MIRRSYSPPYQARAPQPGPDDIGRSIKGLVSVELARTNEVTFAVESFGCDGKPVLSPMRGLACETDGRLTVAGTKGGMPFRLNADLPRGIGSAIRGAGGGMRAVTGGASLLSSEWVLYDSVGNHWSLDQGSTPVYLGATPPLANGDGVTPALCTMDPKIRPYELRWEYISGAGDPIVYQAKYLWGGAGWIEDSIGGAVIAFPVAYPYSVPANYWRIEQWMPDEVAAPTGASQAAAWPASVRHVDCQWYPGTPGTPQDWDLVTQNSIDVVVSKYPTDAARVYMNRWTRPLLEHISTGGIVDEGEFIIAIERNLLSGLLPSRIALRGRGTGALIGTATYSARSDERHIFTPYKGEGWILQNGAIASNALTVRRYQSRSAPGASIGSGLRYDGQTIVTLPDGAAVPWTSEPVWLRVGKVTRRFGTTARLTPLLPRWR